MFVDDVKTSADHRLKQVTHTLQHVHGINLQLEQTSLSRIAALYQRSKQIKNHITNEGRFNSYHVDPNYTKHLLIMEATRLYLSEIAPKRRPRQLREGAEQRLTSNHAYRLGRWMMKYSEDARPKEPSEIKKMNVWSEVGDDLTRIGTAYEHKSIRDLINTYQERMKDPDEDVRDRAKDNIMALSAAHSMYDKQRKQGQVQMDEATVNHMADTAAHRDMDPELAKLMKKYGVDAGHDMDEGNKFTGALAAAKASGKDAFTVDGQHYDVKESRKLQENHMQHHDYQASMARSELYRNVKYGMDMMKMIHKDQEIEPWIAGSLTTAAMSLDKIYHYMDYYMNAEPDVLGEAAPMPDMDMDDDTDQELGETSGSIARMNLLHIIEDSMQLFHMIQPGDHLEGWVAMKLTKASASISCAKHFLDYKQFELHAGHDVELDESRYGMVARMLREAADNPEQDLQHAQTLIAAKSISDDLQNMAEKVARMGVDDLMPLVDTMKSQFGPEAADAYNAVMKKQLEDLLQGVQTAKDQSDDAVLALQAGGIPGQGSSDIETINMAPADVSAAPAPALAPAAPAAPAAADGQGTTPAAAGGNEPLGRAMKQPAAAAAAVSEGRRRLGELKADPLAKEVEQAKAEFFKKGKVVKVGPSKVARGSEFYRRNMQGGHIGRTGTGRALGNESAVNEKWDTEMHTAEKDKGKWEGYTLADLRAKKKQLMHKSERTAAEQKTVRQLNFAIRAKQKHAWGDVDEGLFGSKPKTTVTQVDVRGNPIAAAKPTDKIKGKTTVTQVDVRGNPMAAAKPTDKIKGKTTVTQVDVRGNPVKSKPAMEAVRKNKSPYAIGMYQAKKEAGLDPKKPAHDLPKKIITRAHEIGASIEGTDESVKRLKGLLEQAQRGQRQYERSLAAHRKSFAQQVSEGSTKDLLLSGQGLEGDLLQNKIREIRGMQHNLTQQIRVLEADSRSKLLTAIKEERRAARFAAARAQKPWGVMYESQGKRCSQFFEDQKARDYWVQLRANDGLKVDLINPKHLDAAVRR